MSMIILAASAALSLAQAAPAPPLDLNIPELPGTTGDPTCGGNAALAAQAFCVATTQAAMQGIADQYDVAFRSQGWLAASGEANLTVYVRRKEGGGCTAFQLLAFADPNRPVAPGAPGYFAFATIPGDICTATPAPSAPQ
jgi:hypothetical protein